MEFVVVKDVKLSEIEVLTIIIFSVVLKLGLVLLNLTLFLQNQMAFKILMIAEAITNFPCGLHPLLKISKIVSTDVRLILRLIMFVSQFHKDREKEHYRNKCLEVSDFLPHKLHIEGKDKPLR